MKIIVLLGLIAIVFSTRAAEGVWHHQTFNSDRNVEIKVDYQIKMEKSNSDSSAILACPLYVNIYAGHLVASDVVKAVLLNRRMNLSGPNQEVIPFFLSTQFDQGHFWAELGQQYHSPDYNNIHLPCLEVGSGNGVRQFQQEIAVSVNGEWLTDPVSNTNNFQFNLL